MDKKDYLPIIGLEIHIELKTKSKMFCQCQADFFGKEPNSQVCPVCLGLPGALPVPNKKAVEWTILLAKALNCQINHFSKFDRKHYFYPDLPKGYQISQYDQPIANNGFIKIYYEKGLEKKFRIRRVHLEEDTGKLIHQGEETLIDFNRSGLPLVEIVTEPDFNKSEDVKRFLEELQVIIRYLDVSYADMEKGSMRLEPNISIKKLKTQNLKLKTNEIDNLPSYKVEVKNINSFRFVKQAIDYEVERQIKILEKGEMPKQETRGYDSKKGITYSQRSKEEADDYRYFPEPDIPPMVFSSQEIERTKLPELPYQRYQRYLKNFSLRQQEAFLLTRDKKIADFFEEVNNKFQTQSQKLSLKIDNSSQAIANLIVNKKISLNLDVNQFVNKAITLLLPKKTDKELLKKVINKILTENKKAVSDYQNGKKNALMFLVGQVMRELKGKVEVKEVIEELNIRVRS